ncbi:hypothetical protein [Burkholderia ubonensis]|uniref:hypothetical protein n=1 Tax=Burkholderia ubonensis TaxID=101571 RepID=UPI000754BFF1|nr:hypothetical protein [Burkholderia ubonensis]KVO22727.1 hypothetical protein WJ74_34965 [Burkholderia ubonensis]KVT62204.1 hypothetical protein WK54_07820 [Burkholderia ubonensis]
MPITIKELHGFETRINARLAAHNVKFVPTAHFTVDRLNDARNAPPIDLSELEAILDSLINNHLAAVLSLKDQDTFNVRCGTSHINMPCGFYEVSAGNGSVTYEITAITIIRKPGFRAKDPIEFRV